MSLFRLEPSSRDYLWGGDRLVRKYHKKANGSILAETWELSCYPGSESVIRDGEYAGKTLAEYLAESPEDDLGTHCRRFAEFPIEEWADLYRRRLANPLIPRKLETVARNFWDKMTAEERFVSPVLHMMLLGKEVDDSVAVLTELIRSESTREGGLADRDALVDRLREMWGSDGNGAVLAEKVAERL